MTTISNRTRVCFVRFSIARSQWYICRVFVFISFYFTIITHTTGNLLFLFRFLLLLLSCYCVCVCLCARLLLLFVSVCVRLQKHCASTLNVCSTNFVNRSKLKKLRRKENRWAQVMWSDVVCCAMYIFWGLLLPNILSIFTEKISTTTTSA